MLLNIILQKSSKILGYEVNTKIVAFLHTNNKTNPKNKIKEMILFTIISKIIK